jgi:hypothetical protein
MEAGRRDRQGGVRAILPWPCAPCANCSYWGVRGGFLFFYPFLSYYSKAPYCRSHVPHVSLPCVVFEIRLAKKSLVVP